MEKNLREMNELCWGKTVRVTRQQSEWPRGKSSDKASGSR